MTALSCQQRLHTAIIPVACAYLTKPRRDMEGVVWLFGVLASICGWRRRCRAPEILRHCDTGCVCCAAAPFVASAACLSAAAAECSCGGVTVVICRRFCAAAASTAAIVAPAAAPRCWLCLLVTRALRLPLPAAAAIRGRGCAGGSGCSHR